MFSKLFSIVTEKMMPANDDIILEEITTVADSVPIIDVFHTLELDRAAMIEQRKLEVYTYTRMTSWMFM